MNNPQTIFTFFYALYFAVTTGVTGKLQPFDTAAMYAGKPKAWLRFLISLLLINILPLVYFLKIYNLLESYSENKITFSFLLLMFILSLIGFGLYRIQYGLMLIKRKGTFVFYDPDLYENFIPQSLDEDLKIRPELHAAPLPHIVPGMIWVAFQVFLTAFFLH